MNIIGIAIVSFYRWVSGVLTASRVAIMKRLSLPLLISAWVTMNLEILPDLTVKVRLNEDPDNLTKPSSKDIENPVVTEHATHRTPPHELSKPGNCNSVVAFLQSADSVVGNSFGNLLRIILLENVGDFGLRLVLLFVAGCEHGTGVDAVYFDVLRVEHDFLGDSIGESANSPLRGSVGSVSGNGVQRNNARCHDQVLRLLLDRRPRGEPLLEDSICHLDGAVEVDVHLALHRRDIRVQEQLRRRKTGNTPDNIDDLAMVPGGRFGEERAGVGGGGDVGGDIVEALGARVLC